MAMHTEIYCQTLEDLPKEKAIRAIHQAWLQLNATNNQARREGYDNAPAIEALGECLKAAGHVGFVP